MGHSTSQSRCEVDGDGRRTVDERQNWRRDYSAEHRIRFDVTREPYDHYGCHALASRSDDTFSQFLKEDSNADLAVDLANDFPSELEAITSLLLRIYQAESLLIPRILQLATKEIETDLTSNAVLFRGNSILTKSIEQYMRLIGAEYLEASIGDSIRRLCADKTESFELDPSKMKLGWKERDLTHNTNSFMNWMTTLWNCIYAARQKCPK